MSLVNIGSVQNTTLRILAKLSPPEGVELLSYKRNRMVSVTVLQKEKEFLVHEKGYLEQELAVAQSELPRLLKTIIKREFPRSRKVRLVKFSHPDELQRPKQKI